MPDATVHFAVGPASDLDLSEDSCDSQVEASELSAAAASPAPWSCELTAIPERSLLDVADEEKPSTATVLLQDTNTALDRDAVVVTVDQVRRFWGHSSSARHSAHPIALREVNQACFVAITLLSFQFPN